MVLPSRRLVTRPPGGEQRDAGSCWHLAATRVLRSLTESSPIASDSRTHSRFGSASARPTAAYRSRSSSAKPAGSPTRLRGYQCLRKTQVERARRQMRAICRACNPSRPTLHQSQFGNGGIEHVPDVWLHGRHREMGEANITYEDIKRAAKRRARASSRRCERSRQPWPRTRRARRRVHAVVRICCLRFRRRTAARSTRSGRSRPPDRP